MSVGEETWDKAAASDRQHHARKLARRHTRRVRILRIALPGLGVLILLVMIGLVVMFNLLSNLGIGSVSLTSDGIVMDHPQLSGHGNGRSYRVSATRAIQHITDPRIIDLESISGEIVLGPKKKANVRAANGTYNNGTEKLELRGGVDVLWSGGYNIHFQEVDIDMKSGAVVTKDAMSVRSAKADLNAGDFSYDQDNGIVRFTNGVKMVLKPAASETKQ